MSNIDQLRTVSPQSKGKTAYKNNLPQSSESQGAHALGVLHPKAKHNQTAK